jgi:hypothetical protein
VVDGWSVDHVIVADVDVTLTGVTPETVGGVAGTLTGGTISTSVKFHLSFVGAVVDRVNGDSTVPAGALSRCVQNVSPTALSTHW